MTFKIFNRIQNKSKRNDSIGISNVFTSKSKTVFRNYRDQESSNHSKISIEETPFTITENLEDHALLEKIDLEELNSLQSEIEAELKQFRQPK